MEPAPRRADYASDDTYFLDLLAWCDSACPDQARAEILPHLFFYAHARPMWELALIARILPDDPPDSIDLAQESCRIIQTRLSCCGADLSKTERSLIAAACERACMVLIPGGGEWAQSARRTAAVAASMLDAAGDAVEASYIRRFS